MQIKSCIICHKEFFPLVGNQKKCPNCKYKRVGQKLNTPRKVECIRCGKEFTTTIYNRKFCGKKCRELFHYHPPLQEHICPVCNKPFKTTKGNKKYCSDFCAHKAKLNPNWKELANGSHDS